MSDPIAPWLLHDTTAWPQAVQATPTRRKRITIASAKAKGRNLQQHVAAVIMAAFPTLEDGDVRSTSMGSGGEDVQLSPAARRVFPFTVECKQRAKDGVYTFYDQASAHGAKDRAKGKVGPEPLVVVRADGRKALAIVDFDYFVRLVVKSS